MRMTLELGASVWHWIALGFTCLFALAVLL